ncbi:17349_t:CDS:2, partial [Funneliformis geosporum]
YEVILMLHLGSDKETSFIENRQYCTIWMEDVNRKFITYIPPNVYPRDWYVFYCNGDGHKNRIATLTTLDNSTTFWVHSSMEDSSTAEKIRGGYNENKCFDLHGDTAFK